MSRSRKPKTNLRRDYFKMQARDYLKRELKHVNVTRLARSMDISRPTFYRRLETMTFSIDEMALILEAVRADDNMKVRLLTW